MLKKIEYSLYQDLQMRHEYSISISNRIIYLNSEQYDNEGNETGTDFSMYSRFIKNLDLLNSISRNKITIKSSNMGGVFDYGMAMYDALKNSRSKTDFIINGLACSMGALIPQGADKRIISKNSSFMLHNGEYSVYNNVRSANAQLSFYNAKNDSFHTIFAERCCNGEFFLNKKYTAQDTKKFIVDKLVKLEDWWMSAEEALYYGFVDEII